MGTHTHTHTHTHAHTQRETHTVDGYEKEFNHIPKTMQVQGGHGTSRQSAAPGTVCVRFRAADQGYV